MQSKKQIALWALAIVALGAVGVYQIFFRYSSTHHSSITLSLPDGAPNLERRIADFDRVVTLLDTWAPTAGFSKVAPESVGSMRQKWFSSASNGDEKIFYYTEQSPKDRSFPIEIMMSSIPTVPRRKWKSRRPRATTENPRPNSSRSTPTCKSCCQIPFPTK